MAELIGSLLVLVGAVFHFSAGLGMLRMPDAYTRMQAGTKASTLGNMLVLAGLAFYHPELEPEAFDRHLFRAYDEPDLLACAGAGRSPQSGFQWRRGQPSTRSAMRVEQARERTHDPARLDCLRDRAVRARVRRLAVHYTERQSLRPLAESYVKLVPQELGAPNVITGILLTYRAFDTLGEVAVLFMVAAGVGLVLGERTPGDASQLGMRTGAPRAGRAKSCRPARKFSFR